MPGMVGGRYRLLAAGVRAVIMTVLAAGTLHGTQDRKLSAEEISRLMDNPVSELIQLPIQYERVTLEGVPGQEHAHAHLVKVIPTYPMGRGAWRLVNRLVIPWARLPGPAGTTSGFGDLTYVGAVTPSSARDLGRGKVIWAAGPTLVFPTAAESALGQDKWQVGPAAALAYLGPRATLGLFGQHWWSVAGDEARPSVSRTSLQYFWYLKLPQQWSIGASPTMTVDWNATEGTAVIFPLGIGVNKTLFLGPLPARFAVEGTWSAVTSNSAVAPDWSLRFSVTPVIPAFLLRGR